MANVEYVQVEEMLAKRATRQSIRKQIQAEYEGYVKGLRAGQAGKVTPDKGEKPSLVRDRLRSAARRLGTPIRLRRRGGAVYFRLKESDEKPAEPVAEVSKVEAEAPISVRKTRRVALVVEAPAEATDDGAEPPKRGRSRRPSG